MRKLTHILGVPFDAVTMEEAVAKAKSLLTEEGRHLICTPRRKAYHSGHKSEISVHTVSRTGGTQTGKMDL